MNNPFPDRPKLEGFHFVTRAYVARRGEGIRVPGGAKVTRTGVTPVNVAGTELMNDVAVQPGLEPGKYGVLLGGNEVKRQVCCVPVFGSTQGAAPIRRSGDGRTITLYLNELFADMPRLRPRSTRWCTMERMPDGGGGEVVLINLNMGLPRNATPRRGPKRKLVPQRRPVSP